MEKMSAKRGVGWPRKLQVVAEYIVTIEIALLVSYLILQIHW